MDDNQRVLVAFLSGSGLVCVLVTVPVAEVRPVEVLAAVSEAVGWPVEVCQSVTVVESDDHLLWLEDFYNFKPAGETHLAVIDSKTWVISA